MPNRLYPHGLLNLMRSILEAIKSSSRRPVEDILPLLTMSVALELATDAKHPDDVLKGEIVGAQSMIRMPLQYFTKFDTIVMQEPTLAEYMHQAEICRARESGTMPER